MNPHVYVREQHSGAWCVYIGDLLYFTAPADGVEYADTIVSARDAAMDVADNLRYDEILI